MYGQMDWWLDVWIVKWMCDLNKYSSLHKTAQLKILLQKLHVNGIITSGLYELSIRNQKYSMSARVFFSNNSDNISNYLNNCWLPLTALTVELLDSNKYWSLHKTTQLEILPQLLKSYSMLMVSLQHCGCINFLFKIRNTVWHL